MLQMDTYASVRATPSHLLHNINSISQPKHVQYDLQLLTILEKNNSSKGQISQQPQAIKTSEMHFKKINFPFHLILRLSIFLLCIQNYMPVKFCCQNDSNLCMFIMKE